MLSAAFAALHIACMMHIACLHKTYDTDAVTERHADLIELLISLVFA